MTLTGRQRGLRGYWVSTVALGVLLIALGQTSAFGARPVEYELQVLAVTGEDASPGTILDLGSGPSINAAGRVAYSAAISDGREAVLLPTKTEESNARLSRTASTTQPVPRSTT